LGGNGSEKLKKRGIDTKNQKESEKGDGFSVQMVSRTKGQKLVLTGF